MPDLIRLSVIDKHHDCKVIIDAQRIKSNYGSTPAQLNVIRVTLYGQRDLAHYNNVVCPYTWRDLAIAVSDARQDAIAKSAELENQLTLATAAEHTCEIAYANSCDINSTKGQKIYWNARIAVGQKEGDDDVIADAQRGLGLVDVEHKAHQERLRAQMLASFKRTKELTAIRDKQSAYQVQLESIYTDLGFRMTDGVIGHVPAINSLQKTA